MSNFLSIFLFLLGIRGIKQFIFIGLKDMIGDNQLSSYRWIADNSPMVYSDFKGVEPADPAQRCVVLNTKSSFKWHDFSCSQTRAAVCETDTVSNNTFC